MRTLEGGCSVPLGVHTHLDGTTLTLRGVVLSLDGQQRVQGEVLRTSHSAMTCSHIDQQLTADVHTDEDAISLGHRLAATLQQQGMNTCATI